MTALPFPQTRLYRQVWVAPSLQSSVFELVDTATSTTAAARGAAAEQGRLRPLLHKQTRWGGRLLFTINSGNQALAYSKFGASMAMHVSKLVTNHGFLKWALFQGIQRSWHWEFKYMAFSKCAHA